MITNTNPTSFEQITPDEYEAFGMRLEGLTKMTDVINNLKKRRENVLRGGTNCIPLPFRRFRSEIPGIEQGQYVLVSANQKVSALAT